MKEILTKEGQSLIDIALQNSGDITHIFQIAQENDLSIDEELSVKKNLLVQEPDNITKNQIISYYQALNITVATDKTGPIEITEPDDPDDPTTIELLEFEPTEFEPKEFL